MLQEPMMNKLTAMRLLGMLDALKAQEQDPAARELTFWNGSACWWISNGPGARIRL